jgi:hypothetical protein
LINQIRAELADDTEQQRHEESTRQALINCERAIDRLIDTIETTDSASVKERLKDRENERARLQFELKVLESRRQASQLDISPEALDVAMAVWRGEIEEAREQNDIRALRNLLKKFVTKIELGYERARLWYTYPIEAFADPRLDTMSFRDRCYYSFSRE